MKPSFLHQPSVSLPGLSTPYHNAYPCKSMFGAHSLDVSTERKEYPMASVSALTEATVEAVETTFRATHFGFAVVAACRKR